MKFIPPRLVATAAAFALAAAPAFATWSIILVDTKTGEIAIGNATCLPGFNLEVYCPVLLVGKGGACAQSFIDATGQNKMLIFTGFNTSTPLPTILAQLAAQDPNHQTRQYGMVSLYGPDQLTFSGTACGAWAGGVTGQVGTIRYAIQGNVLTGQPVVTAAETAILNSPGTLGDKLVGAMRAAMLKGGDGRCSCSPSAPTSCGSPPPSFIKSAEVGYMIIARIGDSDGICNATIGCATGSYYMNLNVTSTGPTQDPVKVLTTMYNNFKIAWTGHADHILSEKSFDDVGLPGDGVAQSVLTLKLKDLKGNALTMGGASVVVTHAPGSAGSSSIGAVMDLGNGSYKVPITAGTTKGTDLFKVVVNDGKGNVLLYPYAALPIGAACESYGVGTAGTGGIVPQLACASAPLVGSAGFAFEVTSLLPSAAVAAFAAGSAANLPFGAGGTLLIDAGSLFWSGGPVFADAGGAATIPAPLIPNPALSGLKAWVQALAVDPGGPLGLSATQGRAVELL